MSPVNSMKVNSMKTSKRDTSIRNFLENAPSRFEILHMETIDITALDQSELIERIQQNHGEYTIKDHTVFEKTSDGFRLFRRSAEARRKGDRVYPKCTEHFSFLLSGQKLRHWGTYPTLDDMNKIFIKLNILWLKDIKYLIYQKIISSPHYLKAVLTGKIHSEESFWKEYAKKSFEIEHVDWKVFRDYIYRGYERGNTPNVFDLKDFTKNPINSMKEYLGANSNTQVIMRDLLKDAVTENKIVDLSWSPKRLTEEHLRLTRKKMERTIASKDQTPVHKNQELITKIQTEDIELLNTEGRVFGEGMTMNHCIYTHYWNSIKNGTYIGLHMTTPEDCTIGIKMKCKTTENSKSYEAYLDQIYLSHDREVSSETREKALDFIKKHNKELVTLFLSRQEEVENQKNANGENNKTPVTDTNNDYLPY